MTKLQFKNEARKLKELHGIKSAHAHEILARSYGYKSYNHFLSTLKEGKI